MELQSLIKYSYALNTYHYHVGAKGVNIPLHSFAKTVSNVMKLIFKVIYFFLFSEDLVNISINKG